MKIVTKRTIWSEDLRQTCIKYKWYTRGDCRAYENLLNMCRDPHTELTDELLTDIVLDIEEHSDFDEFNKVNNLGRYELLEWIADQIANDTAVEETYCK